MDGIEALEQAYKNDGAYLLSVCRRYVRDLATAQDMLQDGFVSAFLNWGKFRDRGPGSLRAWLSRIMANTCLMHLRKKDAMSEAGDLDSVSFRTAAEESLSAGLDTIRDEDLFRMVLQLPDQERTVLNMFVFEGFSHREIASALGIKESASAMRLYRAKARLAQMIKDYERE